MKTELLNFDLPAELIAQKPADKRSDSKLLAVDRSSSKFYDSRFSLISQFLKPNDCLVVNNTKVLQARFFAFRQTGAKLEGLFLAQLDNKRWKVMLKGSGKLKTGETINLGNKDNIAESDFKAELLEKCDQGECILEVFTNDDLETILDRIGFPPLPPYIKRTFDPTQASEDKLRYQTVYARQPGAVAAPTAGLHFTEELINQLKDIGISFATVTLHVGAGTFKPVTADNIEDHPIHSELCGIDEENAQLINDAKGKGSRIIAVGTTSVRTLETIADENGVIKPMRTSTRLFIMPGYRFKIVDAMITNFHLPKSTLLAMVAAFSSLEKIQQAYKHAIESKYRFFSYGDSMFIY